MIRLVIVVLLLGAACAPSIPPCGPSTCEGGCCDGRGLCVAGRTKRVCGLGGVACGSCEGALQCLAGRCEEPPTDAGVDGGEVDAGALPDAGRLRTVLVRRTNEVWTPDGGLSVTETDLNNEPGQRLLYEDVEGNWVSMPPAPGVGPVLRFDEVPEGPYLVFRGSEALMSDVDELETGVRTVGRRDEPIGAPNTSLTVELSGVTPGYRTSDAVAASSFGAGFLAESFTVRGDGGAFPATADLSLQSAPFALSGSRGDELLVTLRRTVSDGGLSWGSTLFAATVLAPELGLGQAARVAVPLAPVPQLPVPLALRSSGFEQFSAEVHPAATPLATSAVVVAAPPVPADFEGRSMTLSFVSNQPGRGDLEATITTGNPVAGGTLHVEGRLIVGVQLTLSGRTLNRQLDAIATTRADGGALDATLSPPRFVRLNGVRADVNRTGVGTTPVFEWSPPALGTPLTYWLVLYRLTPQGTSLTESFALRLRTPFTRARIPPGLLSEGTAYYALVWALSGDGLDARRFIARTPREGGRAIAVTAVFTP